MVLGGIATLNILTDAVVGQRSLQVKSIENKRISSINAYHAKALIFSLGIEIKFSVRENVRD